jgi:hypothetical protein
MANINEELFERKNIESPDMVGIINLTQHELTPEQKKFVDIECYTDRNKVKDLLTFTKLPTQIQILQRAVDLANIVRDIVDQDEHINLFLVLIGGAPYLMKPLIEELREIGVTPVFSYTDRVSVETMQPDGSVVKTQVFKHLGYVEAF